MKFALSALTATLVAALTLTAAPAAHATTAPAPATTTLTAAVPAVTPAGKPVVVRATLTSSTGDTLDGETLTLLQTPTAGAPVPVATGTTDQAGVVTLTAAADRARPYTHYVVAFDGTPEHRASASSKIRTRNAGVFVPTSTSLSAPATTLLRRPLTLTAKVTGAGDPDATGAVRFERKTNGSWRKVSDVRVNAAGVATTTTTPRTAKDKYRASYVGSDGYSTSTSPKRTVKATKQQSLVVLAAPKKVVDERELRLTAKVRTQHEARVRGAKVKFQYYKGGTWRTFATARTNKAGLAKATGTPRQTYRYRAVVVSGSWFKSSTSKTVKVLNAPPGVVVRPLPGAPKPRPLPVQGNAVGAGANAKVTTISAATWSSMVGKSWREGCPVGRTQLRLVKVNYWGFDGYRHRGEVVVHQSIAGKTARAFSDLYRNKVSIRSMYRVDRFGYSSRLRGANDYASMAADNTSGFNCRNVVGRPGVKSPHAWGRSIDINPFENPYRSRADGWVPNSWWHNRAVGTYAWTRSTHLVPKIMTRNGFSWTYQNADAHHFDG